eukprot:scaffold23295_cov31-Prasinocladus_malaysianus.AAC.3
MVLGEAKADVWTCQDPAKTASLDTIDLDVIAMNDGRWQDGIVATFEVGDIPQREGRCNPGMHSGLPSSNIIEVGP